jgi:hypothetical protein
MKTAAVMTSNLSIICLKELINTSGWWAGALAGSIAF